MIGVCECLDLEDDNVFDDILNRHSQEINNLTTENSRESIQLLARNSIIVDTEPPRQETAVKDFWQIKRSSEFMSIFDKKFWTNSFAELFPFGRGGFEEVRRIRVSESYFQAPNK